MASFEQRLDALEGALPAPVLQAAQHAYAEAWDAAARAIEMTMSPEHWELILEADAAIEAADHQAAWHVPDGPGRRLLRAFGSRIVARIGSEPEFHVPPRWPLSPVALPPVVAEIYMQQDVSAGLFEFEGKVCADCGELHADLSALPTDLRDWPAKEGGLL